MERKSGPKDVFLHLLAIITLYGSAGAFITLIFQYINVLLPDVLEYSVYSVTGSYSTIRFAISSLVVIFPIYILSSWYLNKNYEANPEKRGLRIRKWLLYFTLFAAALIIMGDLVALINRLLEGELTLRFLLKVLTMAFVAGSVFGYYVVDLKKNKTE